MKTLLTTGWHFMRILRVLMGAVAVHYAVQQHDTVLGIAGGLILAMGIFNAGCDRGGCAVPLNHARNSTTAKAPEQTGGV